MDSLPRISIITPSFNQSQYLEKTIRSVLDQGYPDLEYIVIDGGSGDGSVDIIKKYSGRLARWCSGPDRGQSDAINKGFGMATGEIVAWINSDDVYEKGALEKAARYLADHPGIGMVYGDCMVINANDEVCGKVQPGPFAIDRYLEYNFISQPAAFIRRSAIAGDRLVDESLHFAMDYDLWLRISREHEIGYLPSTLARFRLHSASKTIALNHKFAGELCLILHRYLPTCGDRLAHVVMKSLARLLPGLEAGQMLPVLELMDADAGPGLMKKGDRSLIERIIAGDDVSKENVLTADDMAREIYLRYFGKYLSLSDDEAKVAGSIFPRQLAAAAVAMYRESPARSRRLLRGLASARPGILRDGNAVKLLARVLITPAGDRLLAGLKRVAIRVYRKGLITKYRLVP